MRSIAPVGVVVGLVAATLLAPGHARADEPTTLRMAAIAPDGTGWARELRAFARDVENGTQGAVRMKWYLGGVAGDEMAALDRIRRNQLDGAAGALFCATLAPTLIVTRVAGLVQSRQEAVYLLNHLRPRLDEEFKRNGFVALVIGNFGNDVIFLRNRVDSFAELKKTPMWIWDADVLLRKQMTAMGMNMVPAAVDQLAGLYDGGQIDGMFVIPTAALAFQWATRAHYFIELRGSALAGCVTVSQRAFDQLSFAQQQVLRDAANRFGIRFEELGQREDALLLGSTLERQGVKRLNVSAPLRTVFLEAARGARDRLDPRLLDAELLRQAQTLLADFRADRRKTAP